MLDYFMSGQLQMKGWYRDSSHSIPVNTFEFYYPNGQLKRKGQYIDGSICGTWMEWFEDGSKDYIVSFKKSSKKYMYFHPNGTMSAMEEFDNNDSLLSAKLWDSTEAVSINKYLEIPPTKPGEELKPG